MRHALPLLLTLAIAAAAPCDGAARTPTAQPASRNVLLIVLDTVRDDRVGQRGITPHLDEFASSATVFSRAYSNAPWTLPSHASLFTGLYPVQHRATQETLALGIDCPTLAERFSAAGWATFGASANGIVSKANGLARGFERFDEVFREETSERFAASSHPNEGALIDFLDQNEGRPWFAFVNFIEAHLPFDPPAEYVERFVDQERVTQPLLDHCAEIEQKDHYANPRGLKKRILALLGQLYDAEVAALDAHVGHLLRTLTDRGDLENTTVVITSDHGENLGEHGHFAHVFDLHNTLLEIPLIIRVPGQAPAVREDAVQLLDLFPTLQALVGLQPDTEFHGRDLFAPGAEESRSIVVAEYYYPRQVLSVFTQGELEANAERFAPWLIRQRVAQDGRHKWWWKSSGASLAFDLQEDPGEQSGRASDGRPPRAWRELADHLESFVETYQGVVPLIETPPAGWMMPGFEATIDDPELLERLRALGYVN